MGSFAAQLLDVYRCNNRLTMLCEVGDFRVEPYGEQVVALYGRLEVEGDPTRCTGSIPNCGSTLCCMGSIVSQRNALTIIVNQVKFWRPEMQSKP